MPKDKDDAKQEPPPASSGWYVFYFGLACCMCIEISIYSQHLLSQLIERYLQSFTILI